MLAKTARPYWFVTRLCFSCGSDDLTVRRCSCCDVDWIVCETCSSALIRLD